MRFLDTNVLVRYFARDNEEMASKALELLLHVDAGNQPVITSSLVVFETIFTLHRFYRLLPERIRELMLPVIELPGLRLADKHLFIRALDLFVDLNIPFADAYNAAFMEDRGVPEIYSWDADYDRVVGIRRVEPGAESEN